MYSCEEEKKALKRWIQQQLHMLCKSNSAFGPLQDWQSALLQSQSGNFRVRDQTDQNKNENSRMFHRQKP